VLLFGLFCLFFGLLFRCPTSPWEIFLPTPLSLMGIEENFTAKDLSSIHEQFAKLQNGLTDLHSLFSVIF